MNLHVNVDSQIMIQRMVSILPCVLQHFHRFGQDIPPKHTNWQPQVLQSRQAEFSLKRLSHTCTSRAHITPKEFRSQSLDRMFLSSKATWSLHSCALSGFCARSASVVYSHVACQIKTRLEALGQTAWTQDGRHAPCQRMGCYEACTPDDVRVPTLGVSGGAAA